jgi:hypothetical protein
MKEFKNSINYRGANLRKLATCTSLVPAGIYDYTIDNVTVTPTSATASKVEIRYILTDEKDKKFTLVSSYVVDDLNYDLEPSSRPYPHQLFTQWINIMSGAYGSNTIFQGDYLNCDFFKGTTGSLVIKHKDSNGKIYANVDVKSIQPDVLNTFVQNVPNTLPNLPIQAILEDDEDEVEDDVLDETAFDDIDIADEDMPYALEEI